MSDGWDWSNVTEAVRTAEAHGVVGVVVEAATARFEHRATRQFRAASTVKIPIMAELFRQVEAGVRSLDEPYALRHEDRTPGSGVLTHLHEGISLTLGDLAYLMISISDNTATNVLIDLLGMAKINECMRLIGMSHSNLGRKMLGRAAEGSETENWATPADYALVLRNLLQGGLLSPRSSARTVELLELQQNDRRIARRLPRDGSIRWGSKTGSLAGVTNDVGFVIVNHEPLILSIYCEDFPDQHVAEAEIGAISQAATAAAFADMFKQRDS